MAARRILPIAEPELVSYPHLAFPLAMLQTDNDAQRWVYSNYVQLYLSDRVDEMMMDFFTPNPFDYFVPILYGSPRTNRTLVRKSYPSFVDFVRVTIDEDYYLWTHVDEFYIPGTTAYQNKSYPHGIMIHGYDDERKVFHVVGFLSNQRYGSGVVGYDDMERAYFDFELPEWKAYAEHSILLKTYPGFLKANAFNLQWVMDQLQDYLHAKPSDQRMPAYELQLPSPHAWGMDVYDRLQERLRRHIENTSYIVDHRSFFVLWEHKKMMNRRIAYMAREGYYACSPETAAGWSDLEKQASVNLNLILKYWMTRDNKHLEQLIGRLGTMKADEARIIERMLNEYGASSISKEEME
ncbi:MAG: hypothetical protein J7559_11530 [Cohnella sp.]|nr:hypothetical protein [Cohnella sp.]